MFYVNTRHFYYFSFVRLMLCIMETFLKYMSINKTKHKLDFLLRKTATVITQTYLPNIIFTNATFSSIELQACVIHDCRVCCVVSVFSPVLSVHSPV